MTDLTDPDAPIDFEALQSIKADLRRVMTARRATVAKTNVEAATRIAARVADTLAPSSGTVVSGYWPMRDEVDVRPTLAMLWSRGCRIALPVVQGENAPLLFRAWETEEDLVPGPFGTSEPAEDADVVEPTLLLVPMLAFDRAGRRLGYGGGYYDRTLSALRGRYAVQAIGIAFADQEVENVPAGPHDMPLDGIVTENEFLDLGS
ncbi:MAG: 5-formyltetrahydrofolate cyclo-ligase [Alphaproteobacteria bacterium]|nr:5-formyltetrahydrofolate cyclo-ligase [Alphaproteobacteria bacterium]